MAQRDIELEIKTTVDAADSAKTLGQLKRALLDIQELQAEIGDDSSAEFAKLQAAGAATQAKMASVRDSVGDIGDKIRTLEGTPIERVRGSFELLKESIFTLDVDKAKTAIEGLVGSFGPIEDGGLTKGFDVIGDKSDDVGQKMKTLGGTTEKTATGMGGLKGAMTTMGQTFSNIGKSLLTNPIFLLAAAIAAIVVVVLVILNKLGLLKPMLEQIGKITQFVVDAFNALTDAMGLTSIAAEKEAEAVAAAEEKKQKARERGIEASKKSADIMREVEYERLELIENVRDREIARAELDRKYRKKDLDDRLWDMEKELEEAYKNGEKTIEQENAVKSARKYRDEQYKLADEKLKREVERINKEHNDKIAQDNAEAAAKRKAANDAEAIKTKAEQAEKLAAAEKGLEAVRVAQDKLVARTTEGSQERVDAVKASMKAQYDYIVANNEILGRDLKALKAEQDQIIADEVARFEKAEAERINLKENTLAEIKILEAKNNEERIAAEIDAIRVKSQNELENAELTEEQKTLIKLKAAQDIKAIEDQAAQEAKERQQELLDLQAETAIIEAENKVAQIELELEQENLRTDERIALIEKLKEAELQALEEKKTKELQDIEATRQAKILAAEGDAAIIAAINENAAAQTDAVNQQYAESERQIVEQTTQKISEEQDKRLQKSLETAKQSLGAATNLANTIFSLQDTFGKKNTEAEKKRAKQQFEVRKALGIAGAVISTIEGVINALTAKSTIPEPFGSILKGINAVSVAGAGLANIAKIAATKFEAPGGQTPDTNTGGGAGGGGGAGAPSVAAPSAAPIQQFTPAQFFGLGQAQAGGVGQQQPIQVVVTETDITQTQTRVRVIEDRATID